MAKKTFTPEQIVGKLRQIEVLIGQGKKVPLACREAGIVEQTFYRWRKEYGGLQVEQARRLKELQKENGQLRRAIDQPGNLYQCDREYNAEGKDLFLWLGKQESCAVGMWESRSDFQGRWEGWKTWGWFSRLSTDRHFHRVLGLRRRQPCGGSRGTVTQCTVRSARVVMDPPPFDDHLSFFQRVEDLPVQTFVPQLAIERFAVSVLPRTARFNEQRLGSQCAEPLLHTIRAHLRAVITPHMFGDSVPQHRIAQGFDHVMTVEPSAHTNRQAFSCVFVDQCQQSETAAIVRARLNKVVAPNMIVVFGPQPDAASIVEPQASTRPLLGRDLQAFAPPDALHAISAYIPSGIL